MTGSSPAAYTAPPTVIQIDGVLSLVASALKQSKLDHTGLQTVLGQGPAFEQEVTQLLERLSCRDSD